MVKKERLLVIEPYYGGSHHAFLNGLLKTMQCQSVLLSLPARKWKMRMQVSAPWFVSQLEKMPVAERWFDAVLCSTFVDVAVFRALVTQLSGWNPQARFCTYFHENQFAYPGQVDDPSIFQFTSINFNTALTSDRLAFNSFFNLNSFLDLSKKFLGKMSEISIKEHHRAIAEKSVVIYPGIDFSAMDEAEPRKDDVDEHLPVIVWNHRWEHDKNPEEFFAALKSLKELGCAFKLIVLGQSFKYKPKCFSWAKEVFAEELIHFGYAESKTQYGKLLRQGDIVVSTSIHEFFGISVLEAVRAGCRPLLPNRLSYPELFDSEFLYEEGSLVKALKRGIDNFERLEDEEAMRFTRKYCWSNLGKKYRDWLFAADRVG